MCVRVYKYTHRDGKCNFLIFIEFEVNAQAQAIHTCWWWATQRGMRVSKSRALKWYMVGVATQIKCMAIWLLVTIGTTRVGARKLRIISYGSEEGREGNTFCEENSMLIKTTDKNGASLSYDLFLSFS